jgi:hypothetical protein
MGGLLTPGTDRESLKRIADNTSKPEYKTWSFWLLILGIVVAIVLGIINFR